MDMQEMLRMQSLLVETVGAQKKLIGQSARLLESQQHENARLQQQLANAAAMLQQAAQRLESGGQRFGQDALGVIRAQGGQALADGAEQKLQQLNLGIEKTAGRMEWVSKVAGEQALTLNRAQTTMVWKSLSVLAAGALLALGGASAWAWTKKKEAGRYSVNADFGRAISQADVILCGERLCANIEAKGQRYGDEKQYRQIKARP